MSSKESYRLGPLSQWLESQDFSAFYDPLVKSGPESVGATLEEIQSTRFVQYLVLLNQLHSPTIQYCPFKRLQAVNEMPHEYILCMWTSSVLVGTAQASLLFPAGLPTVHISNVVVDVAFRGKGLGGFLMLLLRRRSRQRWQSLHGQLRYQLTSRAERGTQGFYEHLGFTATPTIRYER